VAVEVREKGLIEQRKSLLRLILALALLGGAGLYQQSHSQAERVPTRSELDSLPVQVGDWTGRQVRIPEDVLQTIGAGDFLERLYSRDSAEPPIDLFIIYFPTQRTGTTIHSPQHCLPGSGWFPVEHKRLTLLEADGHAVIANRYVVTKRLDRQLVLYWYQAHGRTVASEYWLKFYLVADAIRMHRSDGALVRLVTPLGAGESPDRGQRRVAEFAQALFPMLGKFIPP